MASTHDLQECDVTEGDSHDVDTNDVNRQLRRDYLAAEARAHQAKADSDQAALAAAAKEMELIGEAFFLANKGLISFAGRGYGSVNDTKLEDAVGWAIAQMWEAFLDYDPSKGKFSTFAVPYMSGEFRRAVNEQSQSSRGWSYRDSTAARTVHKTFAELRDTLGRTPTFVEVADAAGSDISAASVARIFTSKGTSTDKPVGEDGATVGDMLADSASTAGIDNWASYLREARDYLHHAARANHDADVASLAAISGMPAGMVAWLISDHGDWLDHPDCVIGRDEFDAIVHAVIDEDGDVIMTLADHIGDVADVVFDADDETRLMLGRLKATVAELDGRQLYTLFRRTGIDDGPAETLREIASAIDLGRERLRKLDADTTASLPYPLPQLID